MIKKTILVNLIVLATQSLWVNADNQLPENLSTSTSNQLSAVRAAPVSHSAETLPTSGFADLVEKVGPAVVNIQTTYKNENTRSVIGQSDLMDDELADFVYRFFGMPMPQNRSRSGQPSLQPEPKPKTGLGSGFIVSNDGYVITNAHVVKGAETIRVTLTNKTQFKAKVIGIDEKTDVALLKIEGRNLPYIVVGNSDAARVGQWVVAIGSPFDLDNTVTAGIISAIKRQTAETYIPFIQTDVAVNPGNSGGPLLNMRGEAIGINSQILSRTGGFMGISFATPINEAMKVVNQLRVHGKVTRGRIGVGISDINREIAEGLGLNRNDNNHSSSQANAQGAVIGSVEANGPAAQAGIKPGDIILKYNKQAITRANDLPRLVGETKPGTVVNVEIWREGKIVSKSLKIGEQVTAKAAEAAANTNQSFSGVMVAQATPAQCQAAGLDASCGVVVQNINRASALRGLQNGDILQAINNQKISSVADFRNILKALPARGKIIVLVNRRGVANYIVFENAQQALRDR